MVVLVMVVTGSGGCYGRVVLISCIVAPFLVVFVLSDTNDCSSSPASAEC